MLSLEEIKGDGGNLPCTDEDLAQIKSEAREIDSVMHQDIWGKRLWTEDTRYARWGGQSPDGRKREDFIGSAPLPFEGAMDAKIFTADDIINDRVARHPYVVGESLTLADLAYGPHVHRWFNMPFEGRPPAPHLQAWYERLKTHPTYKCCLGEIV